MLELACHYGLSWLLTIFKLLLRVRPVAVLFATVLFLKQMEGTANDDSFITAASFFTASDDLTACANTWHYVLHYGIHWLFAHFKVVPCQSALFIFCHTALNWSTPKHYMPMQFQCNCSFLRYSGWPLSLTKKATCTLYDTNTCYHLKLSVCTQLIPWTIFAEICWLYSLGLHLQRVLCRFLIAHFIFAHNRNSVSGVFVHWITITFSHVSSIST